jgi:hypothetical protein
MRKGRSNHKDGAIRERIELVQHSGNRGTSHRRNGAIGHRMDMVWQYSSPFPVGEAFYLPIWGDYYLPSRRLEEREV